MRISATAFTVIVASGLLDPALGEGLRLSQLPLHARYVNVGHSVVTKRRGNTQRNVYFSASGGANSSGKNTQDSAKSVLLRYSA
jgi:hypothetical protein